jgi:hypothetical protein
MNKAFVFFALLVFFSPRIAAQDGQEKIPLLISDHHADHAPWLLERARGDKTRLVLVDAHTDSARSANAHSIKALIASGDYQAASPLFNNHDWIHPLASSPLESFTWIYGMAGYPVSSKIRGFMESTASWGIKADSLSLTEFLAARQNGRVGARDDAILFVSIDLDFFYQEDYSPRALPFVFDSLLEYSLLSKQKVLWAVCLSYAWLPSQYAMELLQAALEWFLSKDAFSAPAVTLFSAQRRDTSAAAEAYRAEGKEPPALTRGALPSAVMELLQKLTRESPL